MALREVNLIPSRILNRKTIRRHLTFWAFCCSLCMGSISVFVLYPAGAATAQRRNDAQLQNINRQLTDQISAIKNIREEIQGLSRQQADFRTALKPAPFSGILHKLVATLTRDMWLNVLQIHRQDAGEKERVRLEVIGYAASNGTLGSFLNRLSLDPAITGIVLKYAKESAGSGELAGRKAISRIEFDIAFTVAGG